MIKSSPTKLAAFALTSILAFTLSAQANHIDFIDEGPFNFNGSMSPVNVTGIATASTLGGQRLVSITSIIGNTVAVSASLNPVGGGANDDFMVFAASAGTRASLTIAIGAAANLNANFLDIPMGGGNQWDRVRLSFDSTQMSSMSAMISVTLFSSTANGGAGGSATVTQAFAGGMGGNVDFMLSAFTANNATFTDAVFRDIDLASFTLVGVDGGSYSISSFDRNGLVLIPEPSTYALLGVGLLGTLIVARRRRAGAVA